LQLVFHLVVLVDIETVAPSLHVVLLLIPFTVPRSPYT
jgi:hypothetical protein